MLYTLKNKNGTAKVNDMGAELISYIDNSTNKEYLWQADPKYWAGFSPVLFPYPGALLNDTIRFEGIEYNMPKHGIVKGKAFEVVQKSEKSITLLISSNSETKRIYPYDFNLYVKHELLENGFQTSYIVKNIGNKAMHFCIGAHPSFNCPLNEGESFEDYEMVFEQNEDPTVFYTEKGYYLEPDYKVDLIRQNKIALKYSDFNNDAYIIRDLKSSTLKLIHKNNQNGIKLGFKGYPVIVVWSPTNKQAPFVCVEPWLGLPAVKNETGNFEDKPYAVKLKANKEFEIAFDVSIIK